MKELLLIGGGRWARVLMSVLVDILPANWRIVWVTQHGHAAAQQWCHSGQLTNVRVLEQWSPEPQSTTTGSTSPQFAAAVVATSPHTHVFTVRQLLQAGVPTLCEKPLVLDSQHAQQLEQLAIAQQTPLGVNLELHFASYLERFLVATADIEPQHVAIEWHDPWSEVRYGETKYSDVFTNVVDDMFPHCWSLLRRVTGVNDWNIDGVTCNRDTSVTIEMSQAGLTASVSLSRRAAARTRIIDVNHSTVVLDFSCEPGWMERDAKRTELTWESARPLSRSLQSFMDVVAAHSACDEEQQCRELWQSWPLSVVACRAAVDLSSAIAAQLLQEHWRTLQSTEPASDPAKRALRQSFLFDLFVPLAAQHEQRVEFTQPERLAEFFTEVEKRLSRGDQLQDFLPPRGAW